MGNEKRNAILKGLVFVLALAMLIPVSIGMGAENEKTDLYLVYSDTPGLNLLRGSGVSMAKDYGSFMLTPLSEGMRNELNVAGYGIEKVNNRIEFSMVSFDTSEGPNLPSELKGSESGYYVVQFIGPIDEAWKNTVTSKGAKLFNAVNNNAFIMKMSPGTKSQIEALPFINWVGNYEPAYKLADGIGTSGTISVDVRTFNGEDLNTVLSQIKGMGASVRYTKPSDNWANSIVMDIDASKIDDIAQLPQVVSIIPWSVPMPMNDQATKVSGANLAWYPDTSGVDVASNTWGGLTGYGQVVGVLDTGFDTGSASSGHYDWFRGPLGDRVISVDRTATTGTTTADGGEFGGHGTHCAGIVGGNGWCSETEAGLSTTDHIYGGDHIFAGQAPECMLSFDACGSPTAEGLYPDIPLAYEEQLADGAYVHSNSWGGTNNAYSSGQDVDQFMWDNRDNLVVFAAGNAGPSASTIGDGATAKNDLTVGASGNDRGSYKFASDPNLIVSFSSRGPEDNRNEPDIMAPGEYIASLKAYNFQQDPTDQDGDGNIYNDPFCGEDLKIDRYTDGGDNEWDYMMISGTSMACPAIAGMGALVRQYFVEEEGITPSGVLMKTALLHGTQDMGFGFPSNDQGWGRANVQDSLFPAAPATWYYYDMRAGITTGTTWDATANGGFNLNVESGRVPLKITVSWLDFPGTTSSALLNNINLVVTSPGGAQTYLGNVFSGAYSVTGGSADIYNNVEKVIVANPTAGLWDINVVGATLPNGPIPFAIEVSGDFGPVEEYDVEMTPTTPVVFSCVAGGSTTFNFNLLNFGNNFDTIALSELNLPTGVSIVYTTGTSVGLGSNSDRDISATITVSGVVVPSVYDFTLKGTSTGDPGVPPAQDIINLKMEVLNMATATRIRATTSVMSEKAPNIISYDGPTTDYLVVSYLKYDENGPHIYITYSTDYGVTWTERQAHFEGDGPSDPRIIMLPHNSPDHPNRILIFYAGWDPADETAGSWVRVCYADPPYTSWTNYWLADNTGADASNSIRRVSPVVLQPGEANEEILVVFESIGTTSATQVYYNYATDGGTTWAFTRTTETKMPGQTTTQANFFPEAGIDATGNGWVTWYISDGVSRDIHYHRYNGAGTWNPETVPTVTGLNKAAPLEEYEPCIWSTTEGPNSNRVYIACMRSAVSPPEAPFTTYVEYTDNPTANPPTWVPGTNPYGSFSTDASQSDYPTGRKLIEGNQDDTGRNWFTFSEEANIYGVPQPHAAHTALGSGFAVWEKYYITADAIGKDHLTSASLGDYMYSAFGAAYIPGNTDIWVAKYGILDAQRQEDPTSVPDTVGPITKNVGATPNPTSGANSVVLTATIDDSTTGFMPVGGARYYSSRDATVRAMSAMDGSFNAVIEGVTATVDVTGWPNGDHTIYVSGRDSSSNWGAYVAYTLTISPNEPPLFGGVLEVINPGTGEQFLDINWNPADDPNVPISYKLCRWDHSPSSAEITTAFAGAGIYSGTALTYHDTGVVLGSTYYYVARATDGAGATDTNEVIKSATVAVEWKLQTTASAVAGYQELNNDPMDDPSTVQSVVLGTTGEFQVGTTEWITDPFATLQDVAGTWTFNTYGYASAASTVSGSLYAKVYRYNGGSPVLLFTTGYDNEDIGDYTASHLFTWTYAAGANNVPAGDRVYVEYWVHVTSTPGSTSINNVANPDFTSGTAGWTGADWEGTTYNSENYVATGGNPTGYVEVEFSGATTNIGTVTRSGYWQYPFTVAITPDTSTLTFDWRCPTWTGLATTLDFLVFVDTASGAPTLGTELWSTSTTGTTTWASANVNVLSVVDGPGTYYLKIAGRTTGYGRNDIAEAAFDNVQLNTAIVAPAFVIEYDSPAAPTNILPSLGGGTPAEAYSINVAGVTAGNWAFVSFPIAINGDIGTVLPNEASGTQWDVAKWWDGTTQTWKTYRRSASTNTFTEITNQMGVWLHITANAGDQLLPTSLTGYYPGAVGIPLSAGWNMVGYPSATSRAANVALTGTGATMVSVYSATTPYVTDYTNLASVTMSHGHAYWVLVPSATTWTVNP